MTLKEFMHTPNSKLDQLAQEAEQAREIAEDTAIDTISPDSYLYKPRYTVVYNYLGEDVYDHCDGITEYYDTYTEANARAMEISADPRCYHVAII